MPTTKANRKKEREESDGSDRRRRALLLCILVLPVLATFYGLVLWWSSPHTAGRELRIDQYTDFLQQGRVQEATILESDNRIVGTYDQGQYWVAFSGGRETLFARLTAALSAAHVPLKVQQQPLKNLVVPATLLLPALMVVDALFVLYLLVGRGGDALAAFGRSSGRRHVSGDSKITFRDVAGLDEAIEEVAEIRDYLTNPDRFLAMGASVPKGILLTGPPGCGKTLLARGLAGESNVPFFTIAGSDFVEMFVGVGAARIRDFFKVAKEAGPCIVFIDELDAVGRSRSVVAAGGSDEREATLNQLLVEMDGFESGSGVVVLAATNRPDILDAALLRPGRFDRRITVERPDVRGRVGILKIHVRGKPLAPDVTVEAIAKRTAGFSGADLANVVNEAALLAARRESAVIEQRHLFEAIERVMAGPERRSRVLSPEDRHRIAFHEAGHAVVSAALPGRERVGKVSIIARGHGGGFTWVLPEGDQTAVTRTQLLDRTTVFLAGRAAEILVTGDQSSGAASDLESAVSLARTMVMDFGMSDRLGPFATRALAEGSMTRGTSGYSERLASEIDASVQETLRRAEARASDLLTANRPVLEAVANALIELESLEGEGLARLLAPVTGATGVAPPAVPVGGD